MSNHLSGKAVSLWVDTASETSYPQLDGPVEVDVAVVGGGIAGLTTALLLKRARVRVAVIEAGRVGTGVTGHTTGKVSALHRLVYGELRRSFGERGARTYGEANQAAIEKIAELVKAEAIECDFRRVANYTYAESAAALGQVGEEARSPWNLACPPPTPMPRRSRSLPAAPFASTTRRSYMQRNTSSGSRVRWPETEATCSRRAA